jgi:DNA-binding transcriptional ArsR family regulator
MVDNRLDTVFHALADPTRRGMLASLAVGEKSIGDLAEPLAMSFAGASKHVKVLEDAGLLFRRKVGRTHFVRLEPAALAGAFEWLKYYERFWNARLDVLERLLREEDSSKKSEGEKE